MKSLYIQVYESLKQDILSKKYKVGEKVPSEKELTEIFHVSRITSKKALEKLESEGYVYRQRGRGTFVAEFETSNVVKSVSPKKPLFGLVMTDFSDSYGKELVASLEEASDNNCFLILRRSIGIPEREDKIIQELVDFGVSGLIVFPAKARHYSSEILKMVVNRFPLVLIDRSYKGVAAAAVSSDNVAAANKATNYLIDLGHENIGVFMPCNYETTTIQDRLLGIVEAFAEKQLIANRELWCSDIKSTLPFPEASKREDIEVIKENIKKNPKITALITLEYSIALLAKIAIQELGMHVPRDISIICFDSPELSNQSWNFTHIKQDEKEIGRLAIKRLMEMYHGEFNINSELVPAKLIEGNSTSRIKIKDGLLNK